MDLLLWILAVILVVAGILALFRRQFLWGSTLIIVGLLVGPGGISIFTGPTPAWLPGAAAIAGVAAAVATTGGAVGLSIRSVRRRRQLETQVKRVGAASGPAENVELRRLTEFTTRRSAAEQGIAPFLPPNPRTAKRLLNHVRLLAIIANDRGVFGGTPPVTHSHLAKWVVLAELTPRLAAALTASPGRMAELESAGDLEALEKAAGGLAPGTRVSRELHDLIHSGVQLAPVLRRLVTFEPAVAEVQPPRP